MPMMRACCETWKDLSIELAEAKASEIVELVTEKQLPKSIFSSVIKVLEGMFAYCPVCGSGLTEETKRGVCPPQRDDTPTPTPTTPLPARKEYVCPKCKGRKGETICTECLSTGVIKPKRQVNPELLAKIAHLQSKNEEKQR